MTSWSCKRVVSGVKKTKGYFISSEQWRELGECLRHQVAIRDTTPTVPKTKEETGRQTRPPKNNKQAKVIDQEYIDTRAFVVHGVNCHRPLADMIQDSRIAGLRGIIGAHWLVGEQR